MKYWELLSLLSKRHETIIQYEPTDIVIRFIFFSDLENAFTKPWSSTVICSELRKTESEDIKSVWIVKSQTQKHDLWAFGS